MDGLPVVRMKLNGKIIFWAKSTFNNSCVVPELASESEDIGSWEVTDIGSFYNYHFTKWLVDIWVW